MAKRINAKVITIGKGMRVKRGVAEKLSKKPGMSNIGRYKDVAKKDFAGPKGTYPIDSASRGRSALRLAHNSPQSASIKRKVYAKYPNLKPKNK